MIGRLSGLVLTTTPDKVILDVAGVGYQLSIPLTTFYRLGSAQGVVSLYVHTHVREDAIQLFGFWSEDERSAFERLIAISGIGPRLALAILSGIGVDDLRRAIEDGDRAKLERIPGIGRKTAERVLLELRDRPRARGRNRVVSPPPAPAGADGPSLVAMDGDAVSALLNLGYSEATATDAVAKSRRESGPDASLVQLLRTALRNLVR
jgi:Holliday junction DNA helicase RuvA